MTNLEKYLGLVEKGPEATGDFAETLTDVEAKAVYEALKSNPNTENYLVRPLWFNYETQQFRW